MNSPIKTYFKKLGWGILFILLYFVLSIFVSPLVYHEEYESFSAFDIVLLSAAVIITFVVLIIIRYKNQTDLRRVYISTVQEAEKWGIGKDVSTILKKRDFWIEILVGDTLGLFTLLPFILQSTSWVESIVKIVFVLILFSLVAVILNLFFWMIVYKLWRNDWRSIERAAQKRLKSNTADE